MKSYAPPPPRGDRADPPRDNNFNLVRLVLALIVVLDHCFGASGNETLGWLPYVFSSQLAVEGFFVISGYLIFASYERSSYLADYASRRCRRIIPGYLTATVLALLVGLIFNPHLFADANTYKFLLANLTLANFLHPDLPGVFVGNRYTAANFALWTIKVEVLFYILVPFMVRLGRRVGMNGVLTTTVVLSIAIHQWASHTGHGTLQHELPSQLSFFCLGALAHYHLAYFRQNASKLAGVALLFFAWHLYTRWYILRPFSVAVLVLFVCVAVPAVKLPKRLGDISYGTYVYHSPVIQALVAFGLFRTYPWSGVFLSLLCVGALAFASWHVVERTWLEGRRNEAMRTLRA